MWGESAGQKQFHQLHMQTENRRSGGGKRRQICYTCHTAYLSSYVDCKQEKKTDTL